LKFFSDPATPRISLRGIFLKAVRIHQHGGVEQLRFETSADPDLNSPTNVLIRLHAAADHNVEAIDCRGMEPGQLSRLAAR